MRKIRRRRRVRLRSRNLCLRRHMLFMMLTCDVMKPFSFLSGCWMLCCFVCGCLCSIIFMATWLAVKSQFSNSMFLRFFSSSSRVLKFISSLNLLCNSFVLWCFAPEESNFNPSSVSIQLTPVSFLNPMTKTNLSPNYI